MSFMINSVGKINEASKNPEKLIALAEENYHNEVKNIAKAIASDKNIKIVALAGPSGSGKTTSAHILMDYLEEFGEKSILVSLDDFYHTAQYMPFLSDGTPDYESVNALNVELINKCFSEIIKDGKTLLPKYDFLIGTRIDNHHEVDISDGGIIIAEGLHALNPVITDLVPKENIYKIYVSVNCSIEDDFGEQLLSSRQIRLARRSLRDKVFRNSDINETLSLWDNVVEGERMYLYPFKKTADAFLKTLHIYEPLIYRDAFIALKDEADKENPMFEYFMRAVNSFQKFESMPSDKIPENSLIREFIGNGKYNK